MEKGTNQSPRLTPKTPRRGLREWLTSPSSSSSKNSSSKKIDGRGLMNATEELGFSTAATLASPNNNNPKKGRVSKLFTNNSLRSSSSKKNDKETRQQQQRCSDLTYSERQIIDDQEHADEELLELMEMLSNSYPDVAELDEF